MKRRRRGRDEAHRCLYGRLIYPHKSEACGDCAHSRLASWLATLRRSESCRSQPARGLDDVLLPPTRDIELWNVCVQAELTKRIWVCVLRLSNAEWIVAEEPMASLTRGRSEEKEEGRGESF